MSRRALKACAEQLAGVYTDIFNFSLLQTVVPHLFQPSIIIPVPKKPDTSTLSDFRPVALTAVVVKCFEKLVLTHTFSHTLIHISHTLLTHLNLPIINRSVENAEALALHHTLPHLDYNKTYARILFLDYSATFNTIRPGKAAFEAGFLNGETTGGKEEDPARVSQS